MINIIRYNAIFDLVSSLIFSRVLLNILNLFDLSLKARNTNDGFSIGSVSMRFTRHFKILESARISYVMTFPMTQCIIPIALPN